MRKFIALMLAMVSSGAAADLYKCLSPNGELRFGMGSGLDYCLLHQFLNDPIHSQKGS